MTNYLFKNGLVVDPASGRNEAADVLFNEAGILEIGTIIPDKSTKVIDVSGQLIMPAAVDMHVHLRAMEEAYKETIETGTRAARKGGIGTVLAMANTKPRLDSRETITHYQDLLKSAWVRVFVAGAITKDLKGKTLAELDAYSKLGISVISDDGMDVDDEALFLQAMQKAKALNLLVMVHPEVHSIAPKGVINEGAVSQELGVPGQPNEKEWKAVERAIKLCRQTGARVHLTHLTTRESVDLVRGAKAEGLPITCDATPHHLALTEDIVRSHLSLAKVNPPLRTEADRQALISALKDGIIDAIATDHAPHSLEEKMKPLPDAAFGFSGLETFLPAVFTELYHRQQLPIETIVPLLTAQPATLMGIGDVSLKVGNRADITVVDLNLEKTVDGQQFVSLGKTTPFDGLPLKGWPTYTVIEGKVYAHD